MLSACTDLETCGATSDLAIGPCETIICKSRELIHVIMHDNSRSDNLNRAIPEVESISRFVHVPEGLLRIAQGFSLGFYQQTTRVPKGRLKMPGAAVI